MEHGQSRGGPGAKYCQAGDGRGGAEGKQVKVKPGSEGVSARVYEGLAEVAAGTSPVCQESI